MFKLVDERAIHPTVENGILTLYYAGMDTVVTPGSTLSLKTGLEVLMPEGYLLLILMLDKYAKLGITMQHSIIDKTANELKIHTTNHGGFPLKISTGEKLCQAIVYKANTDLFSDPRFYESVENIDTYARRDEIKEQF